MKAQMIEDVEQGPVYGFERVSEKYPSHIVPVEQLDKISPPRCYTDPGYWQLVHYDEWGRLCFFYGGPNCYSWGWVMDDFGNSVMAYSQIHFGLWDARHHCH